MSYLKYANLCADMVRGSLKEPTKTKAKLREAVYYRAATWKDGKPEKQGQHLDFLCNFRILKIRCHCKSAPDPEAWSSGRQL